MASQSFIEYNNRRNQTGSKYASTNEHHDGMVSEFDVRRASFAKKFHISKPQEVSCFETDENGLTSFGSKNLLREFTSPLIPSDLKQGMDTFVEKDNKTSSELNRVQEAVEHSKVNLAEIDIVSFRNNFNKIMETPYSKNAWRINITFSNNVMYFHIVMLDRDENEEQKLASYMGYKFEQLCSKQADDKPVNPNVEFCSISKFSLHTHRVLLASEIDAFKPSNPKKRKQEDSNENNHSEEQHATNKESQKISENYVELKTAKIITNSKQKYTWERYKLLKFWIQSYLGNVGTVVCGFRDDDGILQSVEHYSTFALPGKANNQWDPWVCLNFTDQFLSWLRHQKMDAKKKYFVEYRHPFQKIRLYEQKDDVS